MTDVALVFPPGWYYTAHPADLSYPAGFLRAAGLRVRTLDLHARLAGVLAADLPAAAALRHRATYGDPAAHAAASDALAAHATAVSQRTGAKWTVRGLQLPADVRSWSASLAAGTSPANPAGPLVRGAARELAAAAPGLVAVALVHPDQAPQVAAFAVALRGAGYRGLLVMYGVMEDVLSPLDFAPDLEAEPRHAVFGQFDAVVVGESERALLALATGRWDVGGVIAPGRGLPRALPADPMPLAEHPGPSFLDLRQHPLAPAPVVDLRLGRGCPWGRCAFCAIAKHQDGYRAGPAAAVAAAMAEAHAAAGSVFFRLRDDLLTSRQVSEVAAAVAALPFEARWSCRARLEPSFTADVLRRARAGGFEEVWVGLESASARVRDLMDKGVSDTDVERFLAAAADAGVRVRLLCLVGYPGETAAEAQATLDFVGAQVHRIAGFSLTPFQLARRSPLTSSGDAHLQLLPDRVPAHDRVAATLPCRVDGGVDGPALVEAAYRDLVPRLPRVLGPDLHHDWMAVSVWTSGWPAARPAHAAVLRQGPGVGEPS